jgi:universal stress protein A
MTAMTSTKPFSPSPVGLPAMRRILVPVDFSDLSREALRFALFLARRTEGQVHVLHVAHPAEGDAFSPLRFSPEAKVLGNESERVLTRMLTEFIDKVDTTGVFVGKMYTKRFSVADTVLRHVRSAGADVMVMGTHGRRAVSRLLMGSVARDVLRGASIPVVTIGAEAAREEWTLNSILFPIDLECHSEETLREVMTFSKMNEAVLHVVHVLLPHHSIMTAQHYFKGPSWIADLKHRAEYEIGILLEKAGVAGVDVRVTVLVDDEYNTLRRHAKEFADLVILGTPIAGHTGHFNRMAEELVATAPCPVLSLPRMPRRVDGSVVSRPQPRRVGA